MMKMTPAETIVASTINPAYVLNKEDKIGSLEKGKKADLVIWEVKNYKEIPYHYGVNLVEKVIKNGRVWICRGLIYWKSRLGGDQAHLGRMPAHLFPLDLHGQGIRPLQIQK